MNGALTKMNENDATSFHSYPCSLNQWLFSQEFPLNGGLTVMDENLSVDFSLRAFAPLRELFLVEFSCL